ncbi:hypothetical protein ACGFIV_27155 [Sphaerisporangium sp. NPDC049003]|uniref:hypothetical protein n=1 Tax=Sphaerisporangium sp. NPDC049003 TaxID=3364517 RepID=UPI0037147B51
MAAVVAVVQSVWGDEAPLRNLADAWSITAVGVIAIDSFRATTMSALRRRLLWASVIVAVLVVAYMSVALHRHPWDWLYVSGVMTFIVSVELSETLGPALNHTMRDLVDSGILRLTNRELRRLRRDLRRVCKRYQVIAGTVVGVALAAAWFASSASNFAYIVVHNPAGLAFQSLAGVVAGQRLGRMVAYARVWRLAPRRGSLFDPMLEHPDGATGLGPVGRFYFRQSMVAALPAVYLAMWWFLIPLLPSFLWQWRTPYLGLLAIAVIFEILAFVLPMRVAHRVMRNNSDQWRLQAARLIPRIRVAQTSLTEVGEDHDEVSKQLEALLNRYRLLLAAPTWPVEPSLRRWVTLNNAALFIPFLSYALGDSALWQQIATVVGGLKR